MALSPRSRYSVVYDGQWIVYHYRNPDDLVRRAMSLKHLYPALLVKGHDLAARKVLFLLPEHSADPSCFNLIPRLRAFPAERICRDSGNLCFRYPRNWVLPDDSTPEDMALDATPEEAPEDTYPSVYEFLSRS